MTARRTLTGAGVVAAGLAGGAVARAVLAPGRRERSCPDGIGDRLAGPAGWPPGTRHHRLTASDGAVLHVAEAGSGRPVLLVHGIALSAGVWSGQLRRLPRLGLRVIAIDLRGHGRSGVGTGGLDLDRVAADIAEVAEALGLSDAVVVGHSMGAMVVLRLLATDPVLAAGGGWIAALGLVATSARPAAGRGVPGLRLALFASRPLLAVAANLARLLTGPTLPDHDAADPIAAVTFAGDPDPGAVRLVRRVSAGVPARTTAELALRAVRLDQAAGLAAIAVPTVVVVGTDDLVTPPGHARALVAAIPGAELVELDGCGHEVMLERPEALEAVVADLVARSAGGRLVGGGRG